MHSSWIDLFRSLLFETALVLGMTFVVASVLRSGAWRRSLWHASVLVFAALVLCEISGVARAMVAWLRVAQVEEPTETSRYALFTVQVSEVPFLGALSDSEPARAQNARPRKSGRRGGRASFGSLVSDSSERGSGLPCWCFIAFAISDARSAMPTCSNVCIRCACVCGFGRRYVSANQIPWLDRWHLGFFGRAFVCLRISPVASRPRNSLQCSRTNWLTLAATTPSGAG